MPNPNHPFANDPSAASATAGPSRRRLRLRALGVVAAILGVSAIALNAAVPSLKINFQKAAVEPAKEVRSIPLRIGPWLAMGDPRMPPEVEHELGTKLYIQRTYVDLRSADPKLVEAYDAAEVKTEQLTDAVIRSALRKPGSAMSLHVAYYTGSVDTVPHIPDRCMLGAGFDMVDRRPMDLVIPADPDAEASRASGEAGDRTITTSYAAFQDTRGGGSRQAVNRVVYFFHVNGDYEHDAVTGVRKRLQNLFETHAYFAKIEVGTMGGLGEAEDERSVEAIASFLGHVLPEVEAIFPDWEAVTQASAQ